MEEMKEKELVREIKNEITSYEIPELKKLFIHTNLSTRKFQKIWADWWETGIPPRLEVDMIFVFKENTPFENVFLVGVEVEYFRDRRKNYYDGLQQILSFGLFGFDSLVLWHIFSENLDNKLIGECVKPVREIIEGFNIPIVYLATRITNNKEFEFYYPLKLFSSLKVNARDLVGNLNELCTSKRNPLLDKNEVEKRKKTMKLILKIPM